MKLPKDLILSIDLGTSSVKAGIFQPDGTLLTFHRYSHNKHEIPWQDLEFLRDFTQYIKQVGVIAISAQSPSIIPLLKSGKTGQPIFYFEQEKNLFLPNTISVFLPQVAYHKQTQPQEYAQTKAYLSLGDYLVYLFTGKMWTSLPQESYKAAVWDRQQIEMYNLDPTKFPDYLLWPCVAGWTQSLDICPQGISVLASNYDFLSSILGLDALCHGIASDRGGSSMGLNFYFTQEEMPIIKKKRPFSEFDWHIYPNLKPGTFNAGLIFPDFYDFLILLYHELKGEHPCAEDFNPKDILSLILPSIGESELRQAPTRVYQSFIQLWNYATATDVLSKAQQVFTEYGKILYTVLHNWPLAKIVEVRASGGPNENQDFIAFKQRATGISWSSSQVLYAELLGNFKASQWAIIP